MNVYLINPINKECELKLSQFNLIDLTEVKPDNHLHMFNVDFSYRKTKFGIELSEFELQLYLKHYMAWRYFSHTEEPYCLIIENIASVIQSGESILEVISNFSNDCDVFFPYNGLKRATRPPQITYLLGYRWGIDAYFISQNAARIFLETTTIKQPIDEEIFEMFKLGRINIYYEDTNLFCWGTDDIYRADRNETIKKAILDLDVWGENDKSRARNLIKTTFELASHAGCEFFLSDGTLLGHIRHGQIMQWDDDIDISLNIENLNVFLKAIEVERSLEICKRYWGVNRILYFKIWDASGTEIPNKKYKFPFMDVWLYKIDGETLLYNYGARYPISIIFPLQSVSFEQSSAFVPVEPLSYLDIKYRSWRDTIQVFPLSHRTETRKFIPLKAEIETDSFGRIVTR